MTDLVANCPRCGAKSITFDIRAADITGTKYGWQNWYEAYSICRACNRATIFVLSESTRGDYDHVHATGLLKLKEAANQYVDIESYVSIKDRATTLPPDHVPAQIADIFREGATCMAVNCYNAAATMFRLCVDLATSSMLPEDGPGLNAKTRRNLGLRLPWLFENALLPPALKDLSTCIKDDGNDGAHAGTITKPDTEDLLDFTYELLERLYTVPERVRLAQLRKEERRKETK